MRPFADGTRMCRMQTPSGRSIPGGQDARKARHRGGLSLGHPFFGHTKKGGSRAEGVRKLWLCATRIAVAITLSPAMHGSMPEPARPLFAQQQSFHRPAGGEVLFVRKKYPKTLAPDARRLGVLPHRCPALLAECGPAPTRTSLCSNMRALLPHSPAMLGVLYGASSPSTAHPCATCRGLNPASRLRASALARLACGARFPGGHRVRRFPHQTR